MYRPVVTICTTTLTFTNSTFCPHSVFMCFVWISEQTAIISLYSINWLVFITETECLLLGTELVLNVSQIKDRAMVQAVSRRPLTAEAHFRLQVSPSVIYWAQTDAGTEFATRPISVFSCCYCSTHAPYSSLQIIPSTQFSSLSDPSFIFLYLVTPQNLFTVETEWINRWKE